MAGSLAGTEREKDGILPSKPFTARYSQDDLEFEILCKVYSKSRVIQYDKIWREKGEAYCQPMLVLASSTSSRIPAKYSRPRYMPFSSNPTLNQSFISITLLQQTSSNLCTSAIKLLLALTSAAKLACEHRHYGQSTKHPGKQFP